jgi:O-antigen ligase
MSRRSLARARRPFIERVLWWIVAATVLLSPLLISISGEERFRLPKELLVRLAGLLILSAIALALIWTKWRPALRWRDAPVALSAGTLVWTMIAATASTNRLLSTFAIARLVALVAFFLAAYVVLRSRSLGAAIATLAVPALLNAILASIQELGAWTPFSFDESYDPHYTSTAFVGNVNDVGAYLMIPTVVVIVAAIADRDRRKILATTSAILVAALLLNHTLTALIAFAAAMLTLALVALPGRFRLAAVGGVSALAVATILLFPPLRSRAARITDGLEAGRYDEVVTGRLTPNAAALAMVEESPLTGVGPGTYGYNYYFFRLRMEQRFPLLLKSNTRMVNFGEAHNDHLQIMAEAGIPAYVLLLGALVRLGAVTIRGRRAENRDARRRFARLLGLPLAVSTFVLMLAQFPLQLAASSVALLFAAAMCWTWSQDDENPG